MNKRIAKKVVKNHERGMSRKTPWQTIVAAFKRMGGPVPEVKEAAAEVVEEAIEEAVTQVHEAVDLSKMKVVELKALAKESGIKGAAKMKKADLIEALS